MEWANIVTSLIVGIVGGSVGGAIINWIIQKKSTRYTANYERKLNRYYHITTIIELYLHIEDILYSISMSMWDVRTVSIEENKKRAWSDLQINKRQLQFITNDKDVHRSYSAFLKKPTEKNYDAVISAMKKDLWA